VKFLHVVSFQAAGPRRQENIVRHWWIVLSQIQT